MNTTKVLAEYYSMAFILMLYNDNNLYNIYDNMKVKVDKPNNNAILGLKAMPRNKFVLFNFDDEELNYLKMLGINLNMETHKEVFDDVVTYYKSRSNDVRIDN